ncbi:Peptidylprolyl isomerase [Favolaschia claudopus]|uniref:peptidylprolyl isomerase n=1 Tax=Favolaschia claudopus TaxID=2862362 RepID=A0AAW0A914_9AGAR
MVGVEVGVWSCTIAPKKKCPVEPPAAIRITNIALGDVLADSSARTTLKLTYNALIAIDEDDDEPVAPKETSTFVCALTPGKIEQFTTNLVLEEKEEYVFEVVGPNTVYLTGNYIDQDMDRPPFGDSDSEGSEEAFDLEDVSSDVEMDPNELDDDMRFEEIDEAIHGSSAQSLKRPRESDAGEAGKSKKQKAESGKPVKAAATEAGDKQDKKKDKKEKKKEGAKADGEKPTEKKAEREIAGGVKIQDTKIGTGPLAKKGNTVSMRYIGKLQSGKIFDSNTKGKPFTFHLGKGEVIKGWDEGIVGMNVGGERILTIPAAMAYGKRGTDGIPGNSTLIFEVKLTDLK